jgi:tetratricopeptide (TPR) repeat protein
MRCSPKAHILRFSFYNLLEGVFMRHFYRIAVLAFLCLFVFSAILNAQEKGKLPMTTKSEKAREYYLKGRDLAEKLRGQESKEYFEKAVAEDPDFAIAHLNLSFVQPTAQGFFDEFNKALALADKVSEGERFWILGIQAANNGNTIEQERYYKKLVDLYPKDERVIALLGNFYFGQQKYAKAIEHYEKSLAINPDFSQPYNQLGYAYRFQDNYDKAGEAFKKYIALIPDDPNPHDSYAELLMKMGKYDESIKHYQKALQINPRFVASYLGMASDYNFKGEHAMARQQLQKLYDNAENSAQKRFALFAQAVSYADEGDLDQALKSVQKQLDIAAAINDYPLMAGDYITQGLIYVQMEDYDQARAMFENSLKMNQKADITEKAKEFARMNYNYFDGLVALRQGDVIRAREISKKYIQLAEKWGNPFQIRLAHELAGLIAMDAGDYSLALKELQQANQQDPYNVYRIAMVYKGLGDMKNAKAWFKKAAEYNALNNLNMAFIRNKAHKMSSSI